jgi:Platelet-activating factor acetylhydrolase, isoform II
VRGAAHLSQSDFHFLFPRLVRILHHARENPSKIMDVNIRAGVEFLRTVGIEGVKAEKDTIFDDEIETWQELEKV